MITIVERFSRKNEDEDYPYVVELTTTRLSGDTSAKQVHRFGDSHSRAEFISGVRSTARLLNMAANTNTTVPLRKRRKV